MAAPVAKRPGARALDRLARLRRERRRAAERLRRLRPPRPPRRPRARARDEGEAQPRRGARGRRASSRAAPRVEAPCEHYPACGGCRFQDLAYEAQVAAKEEQVARRAAPDRRDRGAAARADRPGRVEVFHYRNKLEYSFTQTPDGPGARLPPGRPLGRGARHREVLADDRPRQRDPQRRARLGARASGSRPTTRPSTPATCATSSCARAATPARLLVQLVTAAGERFDRDELRRGAAPLPRGALDPLVGQRHARPR